MCEEDNNTNIEDKEDENEMERILQAMVNGEGNLISEESIYGVTIIISLVSTDFVFCKRLHCRSFQ